MESGSYTDITNNLKLSRQDPDFKDDFDQMLADSESDTDDFERRHFSPNINLEMMKDDDDRHREEQHKGRPRDREVRGRQESRHGFHDEGMFGEGRGSPGEVGCCCEKTLLSFLRNQAA